MPHTAITPEEQSSMLALSHRIVRRCPALLTRYPIRRLRDLCIERLNAEQPERDVFGRLRIKSALETALLGIDEISFREETVAALLLSVAGTTGAESDTLPDAKVWGDDVVRIVSGLRQIAGLYRRTPVVESENFRNLLISFAQDMRVILIMIANRVNLMRQIRDTPALEARKRAASEAAYLYAPLAHKLGLYKLKSELEDLSLKYLEPEAYYHIKEKLNATKAARDRYISRFIAPIEQMLKEAGFSFHIKGRTKSIHSIWQKMKKQHCPFEGVYDLFAIRIILDTPRENEKMACWQVYSLITDRYQPNPGRLRDWLSVPKSNGYESLHITVLGPEQKWVEVQIRTERMDAVAEYGLAAHWRYKGVKGDEGNLEEWLRSFRTAMDSGDNLRLMDRFKEELVEDEVYVFSPKGDLYKLSKGATVLDFAYTIHTAVGNHCVGARVNGKNVSMRRKLNSGDQVEILTSSNQAPGRDWLNIAFTTRAKSKIRQALNEKAVREGLFAKELLERKLKNRRLEWDDNKINQLIRHFGYKELTDFYKALSDEEIDINNVLDHYQALLEPEHTATDHAAEHSAATFELQSDHQLGAQKDDGIVIDGNMRGLDLSLAKCCNPIYGDDIFGFVTVNGGIKIHRTNCPNAPALRQKFGYRIVKARWSGTGGGEYAIGLRVVGNDNIGIVNNMTSLINKEPDTYLRSINIESKDGLFSGMLTVMVKDKKNLNALVKKLRTVKGVKNVSRV